MSRFRKRHICFAAILFLAGMGIVLWFGLRSMNESVTAYSSLVSTEEKTNAIDEFRTVRQQLRAVEKAQLNDIVHDADSDAELVAMAQRQLLRLCEREEQEMTLEGILALRGWENAIVTIGEDNINVLLSTELITQQENSIILEQICRETGVTSGNVKIIPIN